MNHTQSSQNHNAQAANENPQSAHRLPLNLEIEQLEDRIAPTMFSLANTYSPNVVVKYDVPLEQISLNYVKIAY